jgi:protein involved in plasmid replication-relaxation
MSQHVLGHHAMDHGHRAAGWFTLGGHSTAMRSRASERRARSARRGSPGVLLHPRDLVLLGWLAEQYAATIDQLGVLLGCGPRSVQRVLARLRDAGLVSTQRVLVEQPAWVMPTRAGLRACGSQYKVWQPKLGVLLHTAAVNDVRLHIQVRSPGTEWVSERALARDRREGEHLPDALVITEGQCVAVEVELTVKSERRIRAILGELTGRFDMVLYYCAPATYRQLSALKESGSWPTLGVRELPHPSAPEE